MTIVQDVINRFGGIERFSKLTGAKKNTARWGWYYAERFPGKWQPRVLEAAKENGIEVTADELINGHAAENGHA
jgi:hypothetical protein